MTRTRALRTSKPTDLSTQPARIRFARLSCGYSQEQLAQRVSEITGKTTTKGTVSRWESSKTANPEIDTFHSLSNVTGFSAAWLNTGIGDMKIAMISGSEINTVAPMTALKTFYPAVTETEARGIKTVYELLVSAPKLDQSSLRAIQNALRSNNSAI